MRIYFKKTLVGILFYQMEKKYSYIVNLSIVGTKTHLPTTLSKKRIIFVVIKLFIGKDLSCNNSPTADSPNFA